MIKFDYKINRDEHDENKIYTPTIPKEIKNLVLIEGPNSSGKSTLLNMIALSFYGNKDNNVSQSLKEKMLSLLDTSHQKVNFKINIDNEITNDQILIEKNADSNDITIYDSKSKNKTPISENTINSNFKLIYDIPENPFKRLNELLSDLKNEHIMLTSKIRQLEATFREMINEIETTKNPDDIEKKENIIAQLKKHKEEEETTVQNYGSTLLLLKKYTYSRLYKEYIDKSEIIKTKIKEIKSSKKKKRKILKDKTSEYENIKNGAHDLVSLIKTDIAELLRTIKVIFPNDDYITPLERLDLEQELIYQTEKGLLITSLQHFEKDLEKKNNSFNKNPDVLSAKITDELINLLSEYQNNIEVEIPGIPTTIHDFLKTLEDKQREYRKFFNDFKNVQITLEKIIDLNEKIALFKNEYSLKLREILTSKKEDTSTETYYDTETDLEDYESQLEDAQAKIDFYIRECNDLEIPTSLIENYFGQYKVLPQIALYTKYSEEQLSEEIDELIKSIKVKKDDVELTIQRINRHEVEKKIMETKKTSKYINYKQEIETYHQQCKILIQLYETQYEKYLSDLMQKRTPAQPTTQQQKYYNLVFNYLANRIPEFKHDDKFYTVESIDYINDKVITKEGKIINFSDLGTGHAQSNYIMGLLNTPDPKKLIVLLDEIATMDSNSLSPIVNKMKELYNQGKLLIGIIVQKSDVLNVEELL